MNNTSYKFYKLSSCSFPLSCFLVLSSLCSIRLVRDTKYLIITNNIIIMIINCVCYHNGVRFDTYIKRLSVQILVNQNVCWWGDYIRHCPHICQRCSLSPLLFVVVIHTLLVILSTLGTNGDIVGLHLPYEEKLVQHKLWQMWETSSTSFDKWFVHISTSLMRESWEGGAFMEPICIGFRIT